MDAQEIWSNLERIFHMTARELYENDTLDQLHRTCRQEVNRMSNADKRISLSVFVRDVMLSDDALNRGEGWETVLAFLDWVDGGME